MVQYSSICKPIGVYFLPVNKENNTDHLLPVWWAYIHGRLGANSGAYNRADQIESINDCPFLQTLQRGLSWSITHSCLLLFSVVLLLSWKACNFMNAPLKLFDCALLYSIWNCICNVKARIWQPSVFIQVTEAAKWSQDVNLYNTQRHLVLYWRRLQRSVDLR